MVAVGIVYIPHYARIVRASVLSLKEQLFVQAIGALGGGHLRILGRHILPNAMPPIIVYATLGMGTAVLQAAALGFLGLGAQPPKPEWGAMLSDGRQYIQIAPHVAAFPGRGHPRAGAGVQPLRATGCGTRSIPRCGRVRRGDGARRSCSQVSGLRTQFHTRRGLVKAVDGVSTW